MDNLSPPSSRRFLKTRQKAWAQQLAQRLTKSGITPNTISIFSVVFAAFGGWAFSQLRYHDSGWWWALLAILGIQIRLLANMMDGLVAVEGGKKTPTGDLYNDVPDRLADVLIIVGAGYGCGQWAAAEMGWILATLAVLTAYIRCLGASLIGTHDYIGPQAKQHRMALLSVAALLTALERGLFDSTANIALYLLLLASIVGTAATCIRRLQRIAIVLHSRG